MASSKMQRAFSEAIYVHFGEYTIRENSRPIWCLGDKGERLELDFYIEELGIAVEIQGQQHYQFTPMFHKTYRDFIAQQQRDAAKEARCDEYGILLLEVGDQLSFDEAIQFIQEVSRQKKALNNGKKQPIDEVSLRLYLRKISKQARRLLNSRDCTSTEFRQMANQVKVKVIGVMEKYGQSAFNCLDETEAIRLLFSVQKCCNKAKNGKQQHYGKGRKRP